MIGADPGADGTDGPVASPKPAGPADSAGSSRPTVRRRPWDRVRHRIPVRWRQHWKLVAAFGALLGVLVGFFGETRVRPFVASSNTGGTAEITENIAGTVDLYDRTVAHDLRLRFDDDAYQRMLDSYFDEGEKEYLEADLVIDGTEIASVGLRLKGNSTLGGLSRPGEENTSRRGGPGGPFGGDRQGPAGQGPPGQGGQAGGAPPGQGQQEGGQPQQAGQGAAGQGPAGGGRFGGPGAALSTEKPEELPWLISIDEFVPGRAYQNHQTIAVRPGGTSTSAALNEAVSLALTEESGQPIQRFTYSSFAVNDRPVTTRLLLEVPDEQFASDNLDSQGVLYKALSTSEFRYRGEDPTEYKDSFKQVTGRGDRDLQPVIDLQRFVDEASDEQFAAELGERLDVDSFARYLATQNLLLNFDDMSGPGRNYYLWYDVTSRQIQVLAWDLNLALNGDPAQGPHDTSNGPGGLMIAGPDGQPQGQPPEGFEPPAGAGGGAAGPGGPGAGGGPGGLRAGNALKERFLDTPRFLERYDTAYRELYRQFYADGTAERLVDELAASLQRNTGTDADAIATQVTTLKQTITRRTQSLAGDEVITG